jgi:dCTP deaminase
VAPDSLIAEMIAASEIAPSIRGRRIGSQIQPASLDVSLGLRGYETRASFLPGRGVPVESALAKMAARAFELADGVVLEPGRVYVVEAGERVRLAGGVSARANPKSSTGRIDVFVRVICDGADRFDEIPSGYEGPLWVEIVPLTFPVRVRTGSRLAQLRFRVGDARLDDAALLALHAAEPLLDGDAVNTCHGLALTVDLTPDGDGVVGWRAARGAGTIDVDEVGALRVADFWSPVRLGDHAGRTGVILEPDAFYILASRESVRVPVTHAAEMVPFDAGIGELRVHYAGYFDPGFGVESPSRAVLEVRAHQVPFLLEHGQAVGKLVYERMLTPPRTPYGSGMASNYQGQKLKLSKHFA